MRHDPTILMLVQSFSRLFMVFMTGPLAIIGVVPALLIFQAPFGFVALLGVIALGGMIMRNSVILVDQSTDIAAGGAVDGHLDATVRTRPVADGRRRGAGDDPADAQRVLGADGDLDMGGLTIATC
jgi:hypothetical protein